MARLRQASLRSVFHGFLVIMTVALLVIEANLLFATKADSLFAQAGGAAGNGAAGANQPAAQDVPLAPGAQPASITSEFDPDIIEKEQKKCVDYMKNYFEVSPGLNKPSQQQDFTEFMNTHFKSKKPTSELLPVAFQRMRLYQEDAYAHLREFGIEARRASLAVANEDGTCRQYVDSHLAMVKSLFYNHVLGNAYAKKSTRLLDKYKEINTQLERLNMDVAQMYANFSIFAQKLPCYATQCVSK